MKSTLRYAVVLVMMASPLAVLSGCNLDSSSGSSGTSSVTTSSVGPSSVAATANASLTISWLAPDTNVNGSALTDLAGYHIHYGTSATALNQEIDVPTTGVTDYVVEDLNANSTYYFAISSYNSAGVESQYTPIVSASTS